MSTDNASNSWLITLLSTIPFSKDTWESILFWSEFTLVIFAVVIAIGIVGEYKVSKTERWGSPPKAKWTFLDLTRRGPIKWNWLLIWTVFVGAGVIGEVFSDAAIWVSSIDLQIIANREIEDLKAENISLEKKLAWRKLKPGQLAEMTSALAQYAGTPFDASLGPGPEPARLLEQILSALDNAHWAVKTWGGPGGPSVRDNHGIAYAITSTAVNCFVVYDAAHETQFKEPAHALADKLTKFGIKTTVTTNEIVRPEQMRLIVGSRPEIEE